MRDSAYSFIRGTHGLHQSSASSTQEQLVTINNLIKRANDVKKYSEAKYDRLLDGLLIQHESLNIDNIEKIAKQLSTDLQTKVACLCVLEFDCCFCCVYENGMTLERYTSGDVTAYAIEVSNSDLLKYAKLHYNLKIENNESIFDNAIEFFEQILNDIKQ